MLGSVVLVLVRLVELGGSAVGVRHGTEEPRYAVEQQLPGVEIRRYGPRIAAETAVAASEEAARNVVSAAWPDTFSGRTTPPRRSR